MMGLRERGRWEEGEKVMEKAEGYLTKRGERGGKGRKRGVDLVCKQNKTSAIQRHLMLPFVPVLPQFSKLVHFERIPPSWE